MMDYVPYETSEINGGTQERYRFANGYGASVIIGGGYPYGGMEIAVIGRHGRCCYDTPITNGVIANLNASEVQPILAAIDALPKMSA